MTRRTGYGWRSRLPSSAGVRVIPVLVDGAQMPTAAELPPSLRDLARRQAVSFSHRYECRNPRDGLPGRRLTAS
jgi:hypothetical protein